MVVNPLLDLFLALFIPVLILSLLMYCTDFCPCSVPRIIIIPELCWYGCKTLLRTILVLYSHRGFFHTSCFYVACIWSLSPCLSPWPAVSQRRYDMNAIFQMQGGKNWILPKYINANRFFWDSHWLDIWSNHFCPSMGPNGGSVATDSGLLCRSGQVLVKICWSCMFFRCVSSS